MIYSLNKHLRKNIRLKGYDYSQAGLYFITICVQDRKCLFGIIENEEMILNDAGKMVEHEWLKIPERFPNVRLHEYKVMPNHFHAILEIVPATSVPATLVVATNDLASNNQETPDNDYTPVPTTNDNTSDNQETPDNYETSQNEKQSIYKTGQPQGIAPTRGIDPAKPKTVGDILGAFQSIVTVEYIRGVKQLGWATFNRKLWQRNYWEHIIRNEQSYLRISEYIINNPKNWGKDKLKKK